MKNEINHLAPRSFFNGVIEAFPLNAQTGWNSSDPERRKSDFENQVGLGVSLYFKFMKSTGLMFLILTILSTFSLAIFTLGNGDNSHWLQLTTLGHLGNYKQEKCFQAKNSQIDFECGDGYELYHILKFGLADGDSTCLGTTNQSVKTLEMCSLGSMENLNAEFGIESTFTKFCAGKKSCTMPFEMKIFDKSCLNRSSNVYATALCINSGPRQTFSILVILFDFAATFAFVVFLIRLKITQNHSIDDFKSNLV